MSAFFVIALEGLVINLWKGKYLKQKGKPFYFDITLLITVVCKYLDNLLCGDNNCNYI